MAVVVFLKILLREARVETEYVYSAQESQVDEGCPYPGSPILPAGMQYIDVLGSTYRYISI